jgi:hypothetical protein
MPTTTTEKEIDVPRGYRLEGKCLVDDWTVHLNEPEVGERLDIWCLYRRRATVEEIDGDTVRARTADGSSLNAYRSQSGMWYDLAGGPDSDKV